MSNLLFSNRSLSPLIRSLVFLIAVFALHTNVYSQAIDMTEIRGDGI